MAWCVDASFPSLIPFVTPVLPGPGSDIRMKMWWKIQSKTRKSGVWFFQNAGGWLESGVLPMLMGAVDWVWTTQRGRSPSSLSSCLCPYSYGQGTAIGPHTGQRCWPLLAGVWRAIAP